MPEKFHVALIKLHISAEQAGLYFIPSQIIVETLLKKAKIVQEKLNKQGIKTELLEKIGLSPEEEAHQQQSHLAIIRRLFKKVLDLNQPLGKTCLQLEEAVSGYGKTKKIPPPQLREWAADMPHRNAHKLIKGWAIAAAIDVLLAHGINPITVVDLEIVVHYWALQRQKNLTINAATKEFIRLFAVPERKKNAVSQEMKQVYARLSD